MPQCGHRARVRWGICHIVAGCVLGNVGSLAFRRRILLMKLTGNL
jgi:hypothetical protein